MIAVYYTRITNIWDADMQYKKLYQLPDCLIERISKYNEPRDKQLRICGKLLLRQLLDKYNANSKLEDIQYDQYNRPFIPNTIDFNISHSGDYVICAAITKGRIGVDIEQILPVNIDLYQDYFTKKEWDLISSSKYSNDVFYDLWTKKEALIKTIGKYPG